MRMKPFNTQVFFLKGTKGESLAKDLKDILHLVSYNRPATFRAISLHFLNTETTSVAAIHVAYFCTIYRYKLISLHIVLLVDVEHEANT